MFDMVIIVMLKLKMKRMDNDELNEYLECTCGRCDDGKCQCCDCENEHPQVTTSYEEINYDEYIDNLNDWD